MAVHRIIERINHWLSPAAVATSVEPSGGATGAGPVVPAVAVPIVEDLEREQLPPEQVEEP
jgi:hypothetical protein